jgi:hypothetical protein
MIVPLVFVEINFDIWRWKYAQFKPVENVTRLDDAPDYRNDFSSDFQEVLSYEIEVAWNIHSRRVPL